MRRGLLKDYANQVCQMAVGWRLNISDLALLAERGEGTVTFDLIARTAAIDGQPYSLTITREVGAWLDEAKGRDNLPDDLIKRFAMRLTFRIAEEQSGATQVQHVELNCDSVLETDDAEHVGASRKREIRTRTGPGAPWFVRDA